MQVADVPRHRIRAFPTYPKVIKHLFFQASNSDRLPKSTHIVLVGEPLCCPFFLHQPTPSAHPSSHSPSPSSSSSPPVSFVVHKMRTRFPLAPSLPCSSSFLPFVRLPASEQQARIETEAHLKIKLGLPKKSLSNYVGIRRRPILCSRVNSAATLSSVQVTPWRTVVQGFFDNGTNRGSGCHPAGNNCAIRVRASKGRENYEYGSFAAKPFRWPAAIPNLCRANCS